MFGGGVNFFRYADGNPVSEADPLGLDTKVCYYSDAAAGFGHVGFALPQEGEQGTQGFYPTGNPIDSAGKVKPDEQKKPQCKTIPAPKDKDQCMLQCRLRRVNNPGNFASSRVRSIDTVSTDAGNCTSLGCRDSLPATSSPENAGNRVASRSSSSNCS